jgi:hypothetical protein
VVCESFNSFSYVVCVLSLSLSLSLVGPHRSMHTTGTPRRDASLNSIGNCWLDVTWTCSSTNVPNVFSVVCRTCNPSLRPQTLTFFWAKPHGSVCVHLAFALLCHARSLCFSLSLSLSLSVLCSLCTVRAPPLLSPSCLSVVCFCFSSLPPSLCAVSLLDLLSVFGRFFLSNFFQTFKLTNSSFLFVCE